MSNIEDSIVNTQNSTEDLIQPVTNDEPLIEEDDERCQLLINISIDKIDNMSGHSLNSEDSFSSSSSTFQMTLMEKFNYIATRVLYSKYFQYYYIFIIILSSISIVLVRITNEYHLALEALIIFALIIEVTIRLLAQRKYYFYSIWNILDIIIVSVCIFIYYVTKKQCPKSDAIIDNSVIVLRYIIQFIRLCVLLKKNKTSGTNKKRKSVNFSQFRKKPTYGSINPSSSNSLNKKIKRKDIKHGEGKIGEEEEEEEAGSYQNISNIVDNTIYNPYGERYNSIEDSQNNNLYENALNESFVSQTSNMVLSQSLVREYASSFFQESNGSIDFNIDSNANLAKIFFQGEESGSVSLDGKKYHSTSVNNVNDEIYQKLINKNIENNNRNSSSGLPNAAGIINSESHLQPEKGQSNDSLSTNPIETPSSSFISPSSFSYLRHLLPSTQKSGSSSIHTNSSLPPKVGRKPNRIAPLHHSSTFSEIPSKINLLTPILYGSPGTISNKE
ncbi:hypothetical protein BCR36DRAFT_400025 [Piromyces finnis]|uniref:Ion transport domain-containing protein n=1 Tax=Piromyces finnis TaxID=1754191 RepID=A0A1Y1UZI6_9FUNG|nr:hypothetical protein BCR36DRAFT_400025 [Piromyces finnis]|eukprot:ORX43223.1 hypothetical protein BCR36DRAFT_400025 [Piromyces finnis]